MRIGNLNHDRMILYFQEMSFKTRFGKLNTLWTGIIAGIFVPILVYFILYFAKVRDVQSTLFSNFHIAASIIPILVSHCILPNLLIFLACAGMNWMRAAKGILGSTVVLTVIIIAIKVIFTII